MFLLEDRARPRQTIVPPAWESELKKAPRLMMTAVRRPGSSSYRFRIYGNPESEFPPIEMESSLGELRRWIVAAEPPPGHLPELATLPSSAEPPPDHRPG